MKEREKYNKENRTKLPLPLMPYNLSKVFFPILKSYIEHVDVSGQYLLGQPNKKKHVSDYN